ncbi:hypothetical protein GGR57DRAFT_452071 [Xylariaceae sp. FL1272]|nr:hypothetical protein GGR57DRAFT_452071 [Xylariaceae sp. FL1272]
MGSIEPSSFPTVDAEDPYLAVDFTTKLHNLEGQYSLVWTVSADNCTAYHGGHWENFWTHGSTHFTLKKGAQQPDLVLATNSEVCMSKLGSPPGIIFNITGTMPMQFGNLHCPMLEDPISTLTPCSVRVEPEQAASVSAMVTARACNKTFRGYEAICPQTDKAPSLAPSLLSSVAFATINASATFFVLVILHLR